VSIHVRTTLLTAIPVGLVLCAVAAPRSTSFSSIRPEAEREATMPSRELPIDLYGNDVGEAVARYKVDFTGDWYEEHSPDTEVPKLKPPNG
jgi:hypothetical protein